MTCDGLTGRKEHRRQFGFQLPFDAMQLYTWTVVVLSIAIYCTMCIPFLPVEGNIRVIYTGIYWAIFAVGFPTFIAVEIMDPAHPKVLDKDHPQTDKDEHFYHCQQCDIESGSMTKHCRICKKCVSGFDHHCLYLNTCVGERNYRLFFALITAVTAFTGWQVAVALEIILRSDEDQWRGLIEGSIFGGRTAYLIVHCILTLIPLGAFLAILSLFLFHVYICILGVTTYQWILDRRDAEDLKIAEKRRKQMERDRIARQKESQKKLQALELQEKQEKAQKAAAQPMVNQPHNSSVTARVTVSEHVEAENVNVVIQPPVMKEPAVDSSQEDRDEQAVREHDEHEPDQNGDGDEDEDEDPHRQSEDAVRRLSYLGVNNPLDVEERDSVDEEVGDPTAKAEDNAN